MDKATLNSHLVTLLHIVSGLFTMAGFDGNALPARGERSFPYHLHRAMTAMLRPVESATRRLIICMAQGIKARPPKPRPEGRPAGVFPRHLPAATSGQPRLPSFPLVDPQMRARPRKRRRKPGEPEPVIPRIRVLDFDPRVPAVRQPPPSPPAKPAPDPNRSVDGAKLLRRLAVLAHALETMPKQARRFARWRAQRDLDLEKRIAELEQAEREGRELAFDSRAKRLPLRVTPPGGRQRDYKLDAKHRNMREIDEVLYDLHQAAWDASWPAAWAYVMPDTS